MATTSRDSQLKELQSENRRLSAENKKMRAQLESPKPSTERAGSRWGTNLWRTIASLLCIALATALLLVGNILFWGGNTLVKTDRYVAATSPLIQDPVIQKALATNISSRLFQNVDVEQAVQDVLPPRADFIAPTIATQVKDKTDDTIGKILQRPQFQARWNEAQARAHDRFIASVEKNGSDGSIDVSEVYQNASQQLKGTKLAFLADKPLPAKVGDVQIASGTWLTVLQRTIQNIDTWRLVAILLMIIFAVLGVWLSRSRRRAVILLGSLMAAVMFATLIAGRIGREVAASKADPQYSEAVRHAYTIVMHSLVIQTATLLATALLVVLIAWLSGNYASSNTVKRAISRLFSGRLHGALFANENSFTLWVGRYRRLLEWLVVAIVACALLLVRLTPGMLLIQVIIIVIGVLVIEVLAAPEAPATRRIA